MNKKLYKWCIILFIPLLGTGCVTLTRQPLAEKDITSTTTFPTPLLAEQTSEGTKFYYLDYANRKKRIDLDFQANLPNGYTIKSSDNFFAYDRKSDIMLFRAQKDNNMSIWKYDFNTKATSPFCIDSQCEFPQTEKYPSVFIEDIKDGRALFTFSGVENRNGSHVVDIATQKEVDRISVGTHGGASGGIDTQGYYFEWPINGKTYYGYIETAQTSNKYSQFQYKGDEKDKQLRSFRIFLYDELTAKQIFPIWNGSQHDFTWERFDEIMKMAVDNKNSLGEFTIEEVPPTLRGIPQRKAVLFDEIWAIGDNTLAFEVYKGTAIVDLEKKTVSYEAKVYPSQISNARYIGQVSGNHIWERCPDDKLFDIWDLGLPVTCLE